MRIHRRTLLRGLIGGVAVGVALPPLEIFLGSGGARAASTTIPTRFGFFFWGNGVRYSHWTPPNTGAGWTPSPALQPFATRGVKDYVQVISGMNLMTGNPFGHHAGTAGILSGAAPLQINPSSGSYQSTFAVPSIDQVVASKIPSARLRSLELGITPSYLNEGTTLRYTSHSGPNAPNPPMFDPSAVYQRLFVNGFQPPGVPPPADPRPMLRASVLSAVLDSTQSLNAKLGAVDRQRLQDHQDRIRDLENRLLALSQQQQTTTAATCSPGSGSGLAPASQTSSPTSIAPASDAMNKLLAMALACDQTRVFSMQFSASTSHAFYPNTSNDHHTLTHDEPVDQPQVESIVEFTMRQFAGMLAEMKAIPEGSGNVLDHTVILGSTDVGEGISHNIDNYPILVAGRGSGFLKYPSVHYHSNGENTSKVHLSLLHALGIADTSFGTDGGYVTSGLSAIEA